MGDSILLAIQLFASCLGVVGAWYGGKDIFSYLWPAGCFLWCLAWFNRGMRRW